MNDKLIVEANQQIQNRIYNIRGMQVMIDSELAHLYGVETKVLNQAVKRNIVRFPTSFRFQLNDFEKDELVTNCDRFKKLKHSSSNPYAFTEQGVAMLSAVLRSKIAVLISVQIMNAFVNMRRFLSSKASIFARIDSVEKNLIEYKIESENKFNKIFSAIEARDITPKQGIFFEGQIFDAYNFVSDLFRSAKSNIIIIDNYIDDTVLVHLTQKKESVNVTIYTKHISQLIKLSLKKFNQQYKNVIIKEFSKSHDRFIIIDNKEIYHFGASLKDLGKKWFGFSKFHKDALNILEKL